MKCTKCGAPVSEDAKFCTNCGAPVEDLQPEVELEDNFFEETPEKRANPLKGMGISVGTSLEVGGLLGSLLNRKKKKDSKKKP